MHKFDFYNPFFFKVDSPHRHISLMGCMYKVFANVLANRLKQVIGSVILNSQYAFMKGRHIIDGILIGNWVVDEA